MKRSVTKAPRVIGRGGESSGKLHSQDAFESALKDITRKFELKQGRDWRLNDLGQRAELNPPEDCDLEGLFDALHDADEVFVVSLQTI